MMMISDELVSEAHSQRVQRLLPSRRRRHVVETTDRRTEVDTTSALTRLEAALRQQLALSGDPALEQAGQALLGALGPASQRLATELAQQAAEEVAAQLPDHDVDVVLRDGEPALAVRPRPGAAPPAGEEAEARITLRLPPSLKARVEESASSTGDSVNTWVLKALATSAGRSVRIGRRVQGTVRT